MKHLLNNLSEEEKNSIREQHTDKLEVDTSKFTRLMESKLGDVRPIMEEPAAVENQSVEISKDTQEPDAFVGKTVTFYKTREAAMDAFNAKKSNPQSPNALTGLIEKIGGVDTDGVSMEVNFYNLTKNPQIGGSMANIKYYKASGDFDFRGYPYYNEGLRQAFDKKYFQTDFTP